MAIRNLILFEGNLRACQAWVSQIRDSDRLFSRHNVVPRKNMVRQLSVFVK